MFASDAALATVKALTVVYNTLIRTAFKVAKKGMQRRFRKQNRTGFSLIHSSSIFLFKYCHSVGEQPGLKPFKVGQQP